MDSPKKTLAPATAQSAQSAQLGLDFDAPPPPPPPLTPPARAPSSPPGPPAWLAPQLPIAPERGMDALAMACAIQNAPLARALMELPQQWDFNAPHELGFGARPGAPSPLAHLLLARAHHWSNPGARPGFDNITATALSMVERGADFLQTHNAGLNAITLCAIGQREEFFEHLQGHPRFAHALMGHLRVGSRGLDEATRPDTRRPLLGYLVANGQLSSATALISHAGFPPNGFDPDGRLPIGYCRTLDALEALIALGAQPGLVDQHGLNALARAQEVSDTETRDKMITRIANELKKEAKSNPSIMATLQAQNIAALLEAAQNAPKSSLLKTISAFKFDVSKARDPKTLLTPLMAACLGGRMASAQHLLAAGSDINALDANGVPASAYLLAGAETSNGPPCSTLAKAQASRIDFSILSKRGWPVAMEAAFLMGSSPVHMGWSSKPVEVLAIALALAPKPLGSAQVCATDGSCLLEAYALGRLKNPIQHHQSASHFSDLLAIADRHGTPNLLDRAVVAMLSLNAANIDVIFGPHSQFATIAQDLEARICAAKQPCHHTAIFLQTRSGLAGKLSQKMPKLYSHIESAELHAIASPVSGARQPSRL